ncbi:uncharacterized protein LOC122497764 isoform X2 [Leptopilina heterotoma]|uniref:uncharacterized protein LOC122497764 isoform X2 n=1 Tax=Leptopilina heterotoma TaxID=63436 RepID=UPI001CA84214|nr:uncharacterized protein LOC122497764 isoform X2 [Leptopilina heterotoma]
MGGCFGLCISKILDPISNRFYRSHTRMSSEEDEQVEFDPDFEIGQRKQLNSKRLLSFLIMKRFKKRNKGSTLQLIEDDDDWTMNCNKYILLHSKNAASTSYDSDTSLRSTDPQKIIRDQRGISSTPASSLDLEWETEGIPLHALGTNQKEKSCNSSIKTADNSHPSSLTASPWSRVSSPDSLEWDPIEADIVCLDLETERLITEIERLTDKTLRETGDWTVTS